MLLFPLRRAVALGKDWPKHIFHARYELMLSRANHGGRVYRADFGLIGTVVDMLLAGALVLLQERRQGRFLVEGRRSLRR